MTLYVQYAMRARIRHIGRKLYRSDPLYNIKYSKK